MNFLSCIFLAKAIFAGPFGVSVPVSDQSTNDIILGLVQSTRFNVWPWKTRVFSSWRARLRCLWRLSLHLKLSLLSFASRNKQKRIGKVLLSFWGLLSKIDRTWPSTYHLVTGLILDRLEITLWLIHFTKKFFLFIKNTIADTLCFIIAKLPFPEICQASEKEKSKHLRFLRGALWTQFHSLCRKKNQIIRSFWVGCHEEHTHLDCTWFQW